MKKAIFLVFIYFFLMFLASAKVIQNDTIIDLLKKEIATVKDKSNPVKSIQKIVELGNLYYTNGLYTNAVNQYTNALKIIEKQFVKDTLFVNINNKLGQVYLALNKYIVAQSFFKVAEQVATDIDYLKGKATAKAFLGASYEKQGDYLKAIQFENESLKLFEHLNDSTGIATSYENIGSIYEDLIQYNKASEFFSKSYKILKGKHNTAEANVLNNIGDIYRKQGDYKLAIHYTLKALKIGEKLKDFNVLESANKDLSKAYAIAKDYENAYHYRVTSEVYKEKALKNQNTNKLTALQAEYETHKKEAEIQLLKQQNKLSKANQNILVVVIVSMLLIASVLLFYFNKKRKANQKLQNYKARVLQAELEQKQIQENQLQRDNDIKTASLTKYSLSVSQKNKILADVALNLKNLAKREHIDITSKLKDIAKDIEFSLKQDNEWEEFNNLFSDIHPRFSKKLTEAATEKLSSSEIKLAMLLRLNLSSKEIASILRITPDSVRVARHRLRKKLPINSKKELVNFMLEL